MDEPAYSLELCIAAVVGSLILSMILASVDWSKFKKKDPKKKKFPTEMTY